MATFLSRLFHKPISLKIEDPIRSEVFGIARLEGHARSLAHAQRIIKDPRKGKALTSRIKENKVVLEYVYHHILNAVKNKYGITSAAEWMVDNFHIIRAQLKDIQDHLPSEYYRELPKIAEGPLAGLPRIYGIAWAFVAHTDSNFNPELLRVFVSAYQKVQPLTIGELWALPVTLRLVLIENLRRVATRVIVSQQDRLKANKIADIALGLGESETQSVEEIIASLAESPLSRAFAVQLLQRIRFQEARVGALHDYLDQRMAKDGHEIEDWVSEEHNSQSTANITTRNIITSCRLISHMDWSEFFEQSSLVDQILRRGSDFSSLDFTTRDRYRHKIESLARHSNLSEIEIAQIILDRPGYHLIGPGKWDFENSIKFKPKLKTRVIRHYRKHGTFFYLSSIFFLSIVFSLLVLNMEINQTSSLKSLLSFFPLVLLIASEIAITFINKVTISQLGPQHLPRLSLEKGIPDHCKTFIVVPTMLTNQHAIQEQLEQIEIHFLSNQDDNIYLALLTDFTDAQSEIQPRDKQLLLVAKRELQLLNDRYPVQSGSMPRFSIFHRHRKFNPSENRWMGWERKRGKLHEFNRLLLGHKDTTYRPLGDQEIQVPQGIRYIITLDADTKLPRGTVTKLVGTMAHPLNHAKYDEKCGRVVSGYGVLQPRVTPSLATQNDNTIFRKISAGRTGIDPYASAVSDVYQDLFGEGSYTGKGIYDLNVFEKCMGERVPENSVLSHDLLEGNFVRCGFLSDVEFIEDFPSHIGVSTQRNHRWIRGDWQLLPWFFAKRGRPLSIIGQWKMLDNLRRSLVAPATFILFFMALILPSASSWPFIAFIIISLLSSTLISFFSNLLNAFKSKSKSQHLLITFDELKTGFCQAGLSLITLPLCAWTSVDAIARTLYRLFISHKKLLEWTTAAQAQASASLSLQSFINSMIPSLLITIVGFILTLTLQPSTTFIALAPVVLWLNSPFLIRLLSLPPKTYLQQSLNPEDSFLLHSTARRIWHFFSTFVTVEDNFIPPDNFQDDPSPEIAHRSSPTNFGLYLLSILAAKDFGWIGLSETAERMDVTLSSLLQLPRYKGHFYNWYSTNTMEALEPRYISSVDNGNFVGHLFVVVQGCSEMLEYPINASSFNSGIIDTVELLKAEIRNYQAQHLEENQVFKKILELQGNISSRLSTTNDNIEIKSQHWESLRSLAAQLVKQAHIFAGYPIAVEKKEILEWSCALQNDINSSARDFVSLSSWTDYTTLNLPLEASSEDQLWWTDIQYILSQPIKLESSALTLDKVAQEISSFKANKKSRRHRFPSFLDDLLEELKKSIQHANILVARIKSIQSASQRFIREMDFNLLYDSKRKLFSIGLNIAEDKLDPGYYDLLASEARLTSFIAIAKGDVPVSHWFHLGRSLIDSKKGKALVSWSGSMFEYLMPTLVMRSPENSLLDETCYRAIRRHIEYADANNIPWGISESAYNKRDLHLTYQYSSFGVPDLGLKPGLSEQLVIAPYACLMATPYEPALVASNLRRLQRLGALGLYGFYEAVDFTTNRLRLGHSHAIVKTYMAHHQGMALVALTNLFKTSSMQRRFHSNPMIQATELLLQERTPHIMATLPTPDSKMHVDASKEWVKHISRRYHNVHRTVPTTQLLSNGNYTVMLNSAGAGFSRIEDLAVTRWREDVTSDQYGYYFYLKDCHSQNVWSAGYQPICLDSKLYETQFYEDHVQITREDYDIQSNLSVFVSPEENAEIRRLSLTNNSKIVREIEITSYSEIVLNSQAADVAHPAFSNLFMQTEFKPELLTLIASRRPRSEKDKLLWMMHVLNTDQYASSSIQYETSRNLFIGRGRSVQNPAAIFSNTRLSGTVGPVLDPIFSLRTRVKLQPGSTTHLTFTMGVAESRQAIEQMAEKYHDTSIFKRVGDLAWTQAQAKLYHLGIEPDEAHLFQRLTTRLLYLDSSLRAPSEILKKNCKNLSDLWALGISGDNPIILVKIDNIESRKLIRQIFKVQIYLANKGFTCDLVILNEKESSYTQDLQTALEDMAQAAHISSGVSLRSGKAFVIRGDLIEAEVHCLLASEARVVLSTHNGSLSEQIKRTQMHALPPVKKTELIDQSDFKVSLPELSFFNGYGGFSEHGHEYITVLEGSKTTPAPWINVIANPHFGFQVSESGSGYTWSANSRENQLTPWSNDPVCDPCGEAFYICDRNTGALWSPTTAPIRIATSTYIAHHGQGYSHFSTHAFGISSQLTQFVLIDQPVKISRITLENHSKETRSLSLTNYIEWVLGFSRANMALTTITEFDESSAAIFAYNPRNPEHGEKIAFAATLGTLNSFTCDRTEFIGRNSSLKSPVALLDERPLTGSCGGGYDPCASIQTNIEIQPNEKVEISFVLGQTNDKDSARKIIHYLRRLDLDHALEEVSAHWVKLLTKIQVKTPDHSFNLIINRWYLYQTIVCRLWARAAFYQAGGAFGFRDQLQDVMSLTMTSPQMAREQILRSASRQFIEGDVQHWWHPPYGRGVRTHFSDDLLWLPYVVSNYLQATQDFSILKEEITFLEGELLPPEKEDSYFTPSTSSQKASLYEHCARTLDYSLKTGHHGLPLMGSGDWNDGMNHVGAKGKGESVWLAWFLYVNLQNFSPLAKNANEGERAQIWLNHAQALIVSIENNAWDGDWYRRAFFDDGTPLGSAIGLECQIDSLAQTWAVISGAARPDRANKAMQSVYQHLVKDEDEMILLLTPPFNQTPLDPGYIKGYLPGVRENGGQYTHAASWVVIATALRGDGKKAHELFSFLNPINHSSDQGHANRYKTEPYAIAGDVYSSPPHIGRGGWSWYTGAASWLYRAGIEYILGFQVRGDQVFLKPCVPPEWTQFQIHYQYHSSLHIFNITVNDHLTIEEKTLTLVDDNEMHEYDLVF